MFLITADIFTIIFSNSLTRNQGRNHLKNCEILWNLVGQLATAGNGQKSLSSFPLIPQATDGGVPVQLLPLFSQAMDIAVLSQVLPPISETKERWISSSASQSKLWANGQCSLISHQSLTPPRVQKIALDPGGFRKERVQKRPKNAKSSGLDYFYNQCILETH